MTDGLLFSWDELMKMRHNHDVRERKEVREMGRVKVVRERV